MSLVNFDLNRDISDTTVVAETSFTISNSTDAKSNFISAYAMDASSTGFLINSQGITTPSPLSAAFRAVANFYFSSTAASVPVAQNVASLTSTLRAIQVARTTFDDGIASGSLTATISFLTNGVGGSESRLFVDQPEISITSSVGRKGSIKEQVAGVVSNNVAGTVFYDTGTIVFHGGTGTSDFLVPSSSGFVFGAASADKVTINTLQFKSATHTKRTTYFTRAFNKEFNYTNNQTALENTVNGSITGSLTSLPTTYITTVGLYNDDGEILAVAKVSPPFKKDFDKEAVFAVRMNY